MADYIINAVLIIMIVYIGRKIPCLRNKRGSLVFENPLYTDKDKPTKKRKQKIGDTVFHIKSVFTGQRELDDAMKNIVMRKLENNHPSKSE